MQTEERVPDLSLEDIPESGGGGGNWGWGGRGKSRVKGKEARAHSKARRPGDGKWGLAAEEEGREEGPEEGRAAER